MTNLTEQWKKDELPSGMYYIEFKDGDISKDVYTFGSWGNINEHFLKQVLAEVPDYVEWKNMVNCACEEHEANKHLIEENAQLKELLKECKGIFDECFSPSAKHGELYKKIDEVLK